MKPAERDPSPITIPDEVAMKCEGPDQAQTVDRWAHALFAIPKSAVPPSPFKKWKPKKKRSMKD